jgi:hypothetical protein
MSKKTLPTKSLFIFFFIFNTTFVVFSQQKSNDNIGKSNLPPGASLPLKFEFIDYSYKLSEINSTSNTTIKEYSDFLQDFTEADLLEMKQLDQLKYNYYMKANEFYKNLSIKVKSLFTHNELWFVYMHDVDLTNKLSQIK